jgi:thiaminase/transcriptional activator TenA
MTPSDAFTAEAWQRVEPIRRAIDELPFLGGLADGTLSTERFTYYLAQDAHYLGAYARVLATCASQAPDALQLAFWAGGAQRAVTIETALHEIHLRGAPPTEPSPTCLAYTSYLCSLAGAGSYPVLVAGLLPCFWIYQDVGERLVDAVAGERAHPYADWVATYADPVFTAATRQAKQLADVLGDDADPVTRRRMHEAFRTASRFELLFWDAAWRCEQWPA